MGLIYILSWQQTFEMSQELANNNSFEDLIEVRLRKAYQTVDALKESLK